LKLSTSGNAGDGVEAMSECPTVILVRQSLSIRRADGYVARLAAPAEPAGFGYPLM
jgi:hypothetical protein